MSARLLAVLLVALAAPLAGQERVQVSAMVPAQSPAGGGVRDLAFGPIVPVSGGPVVHEVTAAVAPQSAAVQSGEFGFVVAGNRGVDFTLALPAVLTDGEGNSLPVSFNDVRYGARCVQTATTACTPTAFNPTTASLRACMQQLGNGSCHPSRVWPPGSLLRVFVGGAVTVAPAQPAGTYGGTLTMLIVQVY